MGKMMDWCSEYFNMANDYIKMMVLGKTREELTRANGLYAEIHEWAKEVRHYLDLEQRNKIDTDITVANKVEDLYKRGVKYQAATRLLGAGHLASHSSQSISAGHLSFFTYPEIQNHLFTNHEDRHRFSSCYRCCSYSCPPNYRY
jgi:hypothetical protein